MLIIVTEKELKPSTSNLLTRTLDELGVPNYVVTNLENCEAIISQNKPNCVLIFGEAPLLKLTEEKNINNFRGSILRSRDYNYKVVGSLDLEIINLKSMWKDFTYVKWDMQRAIEENQFKELVLPNRNLIIARSSLDVYRFFNRFQSFNYVSVDIETSKTFPICISFAFNKTEAISIPLFNNLDANYKDKMSGRETAECWKDIAEILANPRILKIGQNFKYDESQLSSPNNLQTNFGLRVNGFYFDTHLAFRTLYPELPAGLGFITSVLTKEPYYKDEGKEYNPKKDKLDRLLLYNAKDAVITFECFEEQILLLRKRGLDGFFFERVMPLHPFYTRIERRGILRDNFQRNYLAEKYETKLKELQEELNGITIQYGISELNVNSNGAGNQVFNFLFDRLLLPKRDSTDEKTLEALQRNNCKTEHQTKSIELILEIRKVRKSIGTYINSKTHYDGRLRTSCRIMLETGRSSTSILKPPITTTPMGLAFQTITKHGDVGSDIRSMFIPDKGYVFIEPDLSGAEARVVALLSSDTKLLKAFDFGIDIHRLTYSWIDNSCPDFLIKQFFEHSDKEICKALTLEINKILKEKVNGEDRQLGKKFRHAGNYAMGKRTASINARISELKAGSILDRFHRTNPGVRGIFHNQVKECLESCSRTLVNPFGRTRQFLDRWGDNLFKEAYAQIPQSTISDKLKFSAQLIELRLPFLQIVAENHDGFLSLCPNSKVDEAIRVIVEELERPIDFSRCSLPRGELVIPCEIGIGVKNWMEMEKIYG